MNSWIFLIPGSVVAAWVLWVTKHSLVRAAPWTRSCILILRLAAVCAVAFALVGPTCERRPDTIHLVHVVDVSASVGGGALDAVAENIAAIQDQLRSSDTTQLIRFAAEPEMLSDSNPLSGPDHPVMGTNIDAAIRAAAAILPGYGHRRILLHTDGNSTAGDPLTAAALAYADGIEVHVVSMERPFSPEVILQEVRAPESATTGEVFEVKVSIASNVASSAGIQWFQNRFLAGEQNVELAPGVQEFQLTGFQAVNSIEQLEVIVTAAQDTIDENNRAQLTVSTSGPPRVLIISSATSDRALAQALEQASIEVTVRPPAGLPQTLVELENFDLLVFQEIPASHVTAAQSEMIRRWVRESGGGFLMLGGSGSFGAGGYAFSGLEEILPVGSEHGDARDIPSVALLVILDRSGSMNAQLPGGETKMALANQGTALAFQVLGGDDFFGVFAVDTVVHPVVPLTRSPPSATTIERILAVNSAGGGIYIYTSLAEGFRALRQVPVFLKHIILFSDAADAEEQFAGQSTGSESGASALDLAAVMLAEGITTSIVALGEENDPDTAFLRSLAQRGGGRFYLTNDALNLPRIFTTETMQVAKSSITEEPVLVASTSLHPMLDGIDWESAPFLLGYNITRLQSGANVHLVTENGDPLFATWRYGVGTGAAFTSDASARWASEWVRWPGFGKFWPQVVRSIMRQSDETGMDLTFEPSDQTLEINLSATGRDGAFLNRLSPVLALSGGTGDTRTIPLRQTGPGFYTASVELAAEVAITGALQTIEGESGGRSFALPPLRNQELLKLEPDNEMLARIATAGGGGLTPHTETLLSRTTPGRAQHHELSPWLMLLAGLCFVTEVFVRRLTGNPSGKSV